MNLEEARKNEEKLKLDMNEITRRKLEHKQEEQKSAMKIYKGFTKEGKS